MDPGIEKREIEDPPGLECGVRLVVGVCRGCRHGLRSEVERDQDEQAGRHRHPPPPGPPDELGDCEREQGGQREVGDGHEALGHPREAERRERVPEHRVRREVRPEREEDRDDRPQPEQHGQPTASTPENDQSDDGEHGREPAEVDELLAPGPVPAVEEVGPLGLEPAHVGERAPLVLRRPGDERVADEEADRRRGDGACHGPEEGNPPAAHERVGEHERDGAEREVELARKRDRGEGRGRERTPAVGTARRRGDPRPLDPEEREGEEDRRPAEEVAGRALVEPVWRHGEGETPDRRRPGRRGRARAARGR